MERTAINDMDATVVRIGIDTWKKYVHLHGVNAAEYPIMRKRLLRENGLSHFANLPACVVGVEACSGSHYWARELTRLGHTVRIMAAESVAPYRKNQAAKNDANDAEAICGAASRPTMRFVAVKNERLLSWPSKNASKAVHRDAVGFCFALPQSSSAEKNTRVETNTKLNKLKAC